MKVRGKYKDSEVKYWKKLNPFWTVLDLLWTVLLGTAALIVIPWVLLAVLSCVTTMTSSITTGLLFTSPLAVAIAIIVFLKIHFYGHEYRKNFKCKNDRNHQVIKVNIWQVIGILNANNINIFDTKYMIPVVFTYKDHIEFYVPEPNPDIDRLAVQYTFYKFKSGLSNFMYVLLMHRLGREYGEELI